ncbi:MAG: hypothetical protein ACE5JB_07970 [bacterium]
MKKQMSQFGMGILSTLLILGFSQKGIFGKVPVNFKSLQEIVRHVVSSDRAGVEISLKNQISSLFVRHDGNGPMAMIMLIVHDKEVTQAVQKFMQSKRIPLIFSVSTLPHTEVNFDLSFFQFEQDQRLWQPKTESNSIEMFPLGKETKFGGTLKDSEIHQGIVLLPDWFDLSRPITIRYLNNERLLTFLAN